MACNCNQQWCPTNYRVLWFGIAKIDRKPNTTARSQHNPLDLVERSDINRLHVVLEGGDGLLKEVSSDLVVLDNAATRNGSEGQMSTKEDIEGLHLNELDLELSDAISDGEELGGTPQESVVRNRAHALLELDHVCLVIPWLHTHRKPEEAQGNREKKGEESKVP